MQDVPYGYCRCGCGEKAPIADASNKARGYVRGEPKQFIHGHRTRFNRPPQYIEQDCGYATPCWVWQLVKDRDGYGLYRRNGEQGRAARVYYERNVGPIPHGLTIDHLCRVRACVNPAHLEPVTLAENNRRSFVARGYPQKETQWTPYVRS